MKLASAFVLAALAGGALSAQTPQAPTFRSTTALVVIDVTVLDEAGRPVPGLTADDFEVKLDGRVRPVRAVTYEEVEAKTEAPAIRSTETGPRRAVTNAMPGGAPRVFVMLVDDLSIPPARDRSLLRSASRFVNGLPATDVVGLATSSHSTTLNPTFDHGAIAAALTHVVGERTDETNLSGPIGLNEALNIRNGDQQALAEVAARTCGNGAVLAVLTGRTNQCTEDVERKARALGGLVQNSTDRQLQSYEQVIRAMADAPGLKHLVVFSDGLALATHPDSRILLEPLAKAAAAAGVEVSVMSVEPDGIDLSNQSPLAGVDKLNDERNLRSSIQTIAEMTGGTYQQVVGLAEPAFQRLALSTSALYQIGVSADDAATPGQAYALGVRVRRSGLTVHANRHAVAPAPPTKAPVDAEVRQAIESGTPFYGVPLAVGTALRRAGSDREITLDMNLAVPGSVEGPLAVVFAVGDRTGFVKSGRTTIAARGAGGDYRASLSLPVPPGDYRVRFAVSDRDDHVGSVQTSVTAALNHVGPFLASDLLTGWSGADASPQFLALERIPAGATHLLASLELYPAASDPLPADVSVRFALVSADEVVVDDVNGSLSTVTGALHADGQFPLHALADAPYTLRATVFQGARIVGALTTTVRTSGTGGSTTSGLLRQK